MNSIFCPMNFAATVPAYLTRIGSLSVAATVGGGSQTTFSVVSCNLLAQPRKRRFLRACIS